MRIYEPSPARQSLRFFSASHARYTWSRYRAGSDDASCDEAPDENLEALSFPDALFDLVVTQDVLEHVSDPGRAFAEIARVLKPGGSHVFTVPWHPDRPTERCAKLIDGRIQHLQAPEYHADPFDADGSLVFTRFGSDLVGLVDRVSGTQTSVIECRDRSRGIVGANLFVFHSRKPVHEARAS